MARLKEQYKDWEPHHYTIADTEEVKAEEVKIVMAPVATNNITAPRRVGNGPLFRP